MAVQQELIYALSNCTVYNDLECKHMVFLYQFVTADNISTDITLIAKTSLVHRVVLHTHYC